MMKRWIKVGCLVAIVSLFIGLALFVWVVFSSVDAVFESVTDADEYTPFIARTSDHPHFQHFPKEIPSNAIKAEFYYLPSAMQGGTVVELKLTLPTQEISNLRSRFTNQAQFLGRSDMENLPFPIPRFVTDDLDTPPVYDLIVLYANDFGNETNRWNHATLFGVAIDEANQTVVYWYEDW